MKVHFFSISVTLSIPFSSFLFCLLFLLSLSNNLLFAQINEADNQETEQKTQKIEKNKKPKVKKSTHLWGFNPYVGNEPSYQKGEFDVNFLPILYQTSFSKRVDFRVNPILNFGFREVGALISHIGFETAVPIFIFKKEERFLPSKGFYIAPVFMLSTARFDKTNRGFWGEIGYNLLIANKYGLSLGLQYGKTHYIYKFSDNEVGNHWGLKIIFGKWY